MIDIESFQIFSTFAMAIFIEVMPFLAFGALISALVEVYVSQERMLRLIPKSVAGGIALGIGAGFYTTDLRMWCCSHCQKVDS